MSDDTAVESAIKLVEENNTAFNAVNDFNPDTLFSEPFVFCRLEFCRLSPALFKFDKDEYSSFDEKSVGGTIASDPLTFAA